MPDPSRCAFSGGAAHPATGCQYGPRTLACWRCTLAAWAWIRARVNGKSGRKRGGAFREGPSFYDAAGRWRR